MKQSNSKIQPETTTDCKQSYTEATLYLDRIFKALNTLTTAGSPGPGPVPNSGSEFAPECAAGEPTEYLNEVFKQNIQTLVTEMKQSETLKAALGDSVTLLLGKSTNTQCSKREIFTERDRFVEVCLLLLHRITCLVRDISQSSNTRANPSDTQTRKGNPQLDPSVLSASQLKTLSTSLQFVVVLGISPYLSPGVGLPVSQRLGPGQILLATPCDYSETLSHMGRIQSLLPPVKLLCEMSEVESLRDSVLNNHLEDILSALFQLRFSVKCALEDKTICGTKSLSDESDKTESKLATQESSSSNSVYKPHSPTEPRQMSTPVYPSSSAALPDIYLYKPDQSWTLGLVREFCNIYIDMVVRLSSTQHVLKSLMMLSTCGKPSSMSVPTKPPTWYRRTVAGLLRDVLVMSKGVQHLIALMVAETPEGHDWQRCRAVAQVIAQLPTTPANRQQFYTSVTEQLLSLIKSETPSPSPVVIRIVGATLAELNTQQTDIMDATCFSGLFEPLHRISSTNNKKPIAEDGIIVSESALVSCVNCLHRVFVSGQGPQSSVCDKLKTVANVLFATLMASRQGVSPLKTQCSDLLGAYISQLESSTAVECLLSMSVGSSSAGIQSGVCLTPGDQGGLQAVRTSQPETEETNIDTWTSRVDTVLDILGSVTARKDDLVPHLFLTLLQKLTDIVKTECRSSAGSNIKLPVHLLSSTQRTNQQAELREKICLVSLLAGLGEKYGDEVITCGGHVLEFCQATLERCVQVCQVSTDEETTTFEWETVAMAMGLLTAVLSSGIEIGDKSNLLDDLLPLLNFISSSDATDPRVREMADDLKVAVATKGLVWAELSKIRKSQEGSKQEKNQTTGHTKDVKKKSLIKVLSETTLDDKTDKDKVELNPGDNRKDASLSPLEQALSELCDPMLPVRGHGLIALARLVEERSPEVADKKDVLLKVFLENLTHSDSYIYLASVNGLTALSDLCPDEVIPRLASELRLVGLEQSAKVKDNKMSGELTLKLGEALVKAARRLGELTPKYREVLLSSILCVCKHPDPITRASSLSGLAEVCQLLRFALGPVVHEIMTCCNGVISLDPDPEPRKAATLTFTFILRGLGKDALMTLDKVLIDIYRSLKKAVQQDSNEGVRLQASLALEELDVIMRDALFAKPQISKKISILGYQ